MVESADAEKAAKMTVGAGVTASNLLVVVGATASGKSALAMELAQRHHAEILSVDSMQVYRGMDIGTAKPSLAEQRLVRHHLIDLVDPDQPFTVARFVEMADAVIADAARRGVRLIITGGTPLYYKALFEGLFEGPGSDAELRERLRALGNTELHRRLTQVDPVAAARIHVNDDRRLIRALEVYELTGKSITDHQREWGGEHRHPATWVGLHWEREQLNRRINARVRQMIEAGWVDEVRTLLDRYGDLSQTAGEATGYSDLIAHVQGKLSLDDAVESIKIATRQLARRQMKWFRRFSQVQWLEGALPLGELHVTGWE
jgi:tRNA dimethylallyltransferase